MHSWWSQAQNYFIPTVDNSAGGPLFSSAPGWYPSHSTNHLSSYHVNVTYSGVPEQPSVKENILDWLDRRIDEVTRLAFA